MIINLCVYFILNLIHTIRFVKLNLIPKNWQKTISNEPWEKRSNFIHGLKLNRFYDQITFDFDNFNKWNSYSGLGQGNANWLGYEKPLLHQLHAWGRAHWTGFVFRCFHPEISGFQGGNSIFIKNLDIAFWKKMAQAMSKSNEAYPGKGVLRIY